MKKRYLLFFFLTGLILMNGCQKEHSFESGAGASEGTLQDDGTGDCLPKTVNGTYVVGTALVTTTNFIEVQVDITTPGSFSIYTDTVNGIYFRTAGVFTTTGLTTVQLKGYGTPQAAGIHNFIVSYGSSGCTISVTTAGTLGAFTLNGAPGLCMSASVAGTYTQNTALNPATNTVTINVNVTALGAYSITTNISNGMIFTGSGAFTALGAQAIVLSGSGTPSSSGPTNIPVTAGTSSCGFNIDVVAAAGAATFTLNCASAVANGTYTAGTALIAANTITLTANVTVAGTYTISTTTINGMTFSATGTFTVGTAQPVTLTPTAGSNPTAAGPTTVAITPGTCTVPITVAPAAGAATFTINCPSVTANGTYTAGTALTAANTITLTANVTVAGTYTISTTAINGMTFSATGTFVVGAAQPVTLTATAGSNPTNPGPTTVAVTPGTCTVLITVGGVAVSDYFPRTTNSNWSYEYDNVSTDSVLAKVIAATHTALGNQYNIFMGTSGATTDSFGYYRKSGSDYYHYVNLNQYFAGFLDNIQRVEFIFLKDNLNQNDTWTTPAFANSASGTPLSIRIKFTIVSQNITVSVNSSTGTASYPNTIVVKEEYEYNLGVGGWQPIPDVYYLDYYSKNVGWIKDEFYDASVSTTIPESIQEMRRYTVY